jgi:prepilin-type N-terminal cleavage/methylation domain-containing protein
MKTLRPRAFTLIEILVVVSIIGIIIGLSIPAISSAIDKGNQARDLNNIRQLGIVLFNDATDNSGRFRNTDPNNATAHTSTEVFRALSADGTLKSLDVLSGTGLIPPADTNFDYTSVAWDYVVKDPSTPLTTADATAPLLFSYGANDSTLLTTNVIHLNGRMLGGSQTNSALWGDRGILVYYVGGQAVWIKAKTNTVILNSPNMGTNTILRRK